MSDFSKEEIRKVVIIGGGASGMLASIILGEHGVDTLVLERMDKTCKKIYATGNGKCNYTNLYMDEKCYNGGIDKIMPVISKFDNMAVMDFFLERGVPSFEVNGYVYPHSRQASSIANALNISALSTNNVTISLKSNVKSVEKNDNDSYKITYEEQVNKADSKKKDKPVFVRKTVIAQYVIIAAGGRSQSKLGSDGSGTYLAKKLNHTIVEEKPALCKIEVEEDTKDIQGVRIVAKVNEECGEIIFNENGISGIPVFQLSHEIGNDISNKKNTCLQIDTVFDLNEIVVRKAIQKNISNCNDNIYCGIIPDKLGIYIMKKNDINTSRAKYVPIEEIIDALNLKFRAVKLAGFEDSQVTSGGVSIDDIDINTMQSQKCDNLYFCGEVMDVDGICGGYNLQWAFTSGYIAAMDIVNKTLIEE